MKNNEFYLVCCANEGAVVKDLWGLNRNECEPIRSFYQNYYMSHLEVIDLSEIEMYWKRTYFENTYNPKLGYVGILEYTNGDHVAEILKINGVAKKIQIK